MGFFDKLKDVGQNVLTGGFNSAARDLMAKQAQMPPMNNPDGTMSAEGMAAQQEMGRNALNNNSMVKMLISKDVMAGFNKTMEDAFSRQNQMIEMMNEHQQKKMAVAESDTVAGVTAKDVDATEG